MKSHMNNSNPIVIYTAESNTDADFAQQYLAQNGVEAFSVEDNSLVGYWMGGTLPGIHKPQVWVNKPDAELAAKLIQRYLETKQDKASDAPSEETESIEVACDDCGFLNTFPGSLAGSVQDCEKCKSYLDVGDLGWPSDFDFGEPES